MVVSEYADYTDLLDIAAQCRASNIPIIVGEAMSFYGRVLVDLGENYTVHDKDGEPIVEVNLDTIDATGLVSLAKG